MSTAFSAALPAPRRPQFHNAPLKRGAIYLAMLGALGSSAWSTSTWAAEPSLDSLQKENAALREQIMALLAQQGQAAPSASSAAANSSQTPSPTSRPSGEAVATATLEGVEVRARKPLAAVKELAQSISVVSGDELKRDDAASLEAITKRLANVKWNYGNSSTSSYSIRGLGKLANNHAADPSVGLYVDGVAFAYNPLGSFDFYDVDTAAVSRGPQGFAFGKNATVGAIQLRYKRPSFVPSADVSIGFNAYEGQSYGKANANITANASATGPFVDGLLAYRSALRVSKGGGWILNSYNPDNQYINSDRVSGRLQLLLTPSPDFEARLVLDANPRNQENSNIGSTNFFFNATPASYANGAANTALSTERRLSRPWFTRNASYTVSGDYYNQEFIASDSQQGVVTGSNGAWLELNWRLNDDHRLTSVSAFKDYYFNAFRDDEGTVFDVQTAAGQNMKYAQYSQELRLNSRLSEDLQLTSGLFLLKSRNGYGSNAIFGSDGGAWHASDAQYGRLDQNSAGRQLLSDSLADLWTKGPITARNQTVALFGSADWSLSEALVLNAGVRASQEQRRLSQAQFIHQQGFGSALSPGNAGGFNSDGNGLLGSNSAAQLAIADGVAQRYFGQANYAALSAAQRRQVADAKSIRSGRLGSLFGEFEAEEVDGKHLTWSLSPRYRLNADATVYASLAHGEKAGLPRIRAVDGKPVSELVKPEKTNSFELGLKSSLLEGNLLLNAALFRNDIKDYQQTVFFLDEVATNNSANNPSGNPIYASGPGNVPKVRAQGLELDAVYSGWRHLELRLAGAYTDAHYVKNPFAARPVERANEGAFFDASGLTLPGASKYTLSLGATYRLPLQGDRVLTTGFNTAFASRFNSDNNLSDYAWIHGSSSTDLFLGLSGHGGKWDINVFVKNAFADDTRRNQTWNAWAPGFARQFGFTFGTKL